MSLAYVDAICRKRKEKADLVEYRNRDKKKLHESILQSEDHPEGAGFVAFLSSSDCPPYRGKRIIANCALIY
jgi:hypothetical protein